MFNIENRRYTGNKEKLKKWIFDLIDENCTGNSFLDLFSGTGVIAAEATKKYPEVILNDLLFSNEIIYNAFFNNSEFSFEKLEKLKENFNSLDSSQIPQNYFSNNFGGKYFSVECAKKIWEIRSNIEILLINKKVNKKEYSILLASLLYSSDKIADTVGHYDAYFQTKKRSNKFHFELIQPLNTKKNIVTINREDSNQLVRKVQADITYIDPPYNSRQYSRFYHVLETIVKFVETELYGVAMKPLPENMSDYCRSKAPLVFEDLIHHLDTNYIIISYNNTYNSKSKSSKNKITLEEIETTLKKRGKVLKFEKPHKSFNTGKTQFNDHKELLFIVKVSKE